MRVKTSTEKYKDFVKFYNIFNFNFFQNNKTDRVMIKGHSIIKFLFQSQS